MEAQRIQWFDVAKGGAISLMVFGHVIGGALSRKWLPEQFRLLYEFLYTFHMPAFFIISGWLAVGTLQRNGPRYYLYSRLGGIAYPYILWSVITLVAMSQLAQYTVIGSFSFEPATELRALLLGQRSWFLWCLFVVSVLYLLLDRMSRPAAAAIVLLAYIAATFFAKFTELEVAANIVALHFIYFLAGALMPGLEGRAVVGGLASLERRGALVLAAIALGLCFGCVLLDIHGNPILRPMLGLCGGAGFLLIARAIPAPAAAVIAALGAASIEIFLLHPYFQGGTREALLRLGVAPGFVLVTSQVAAGIIGPFLVAIVAKRYGLDLLFRIRPPVAQGVRA